MVTGWNMHLIQQQDAELAQYFFDAPSAYATGNEQGTQNQVLTGYGTTATLKYESYETFASDVAKGAVDPSIRAVAYDPEKWSRTPLVEQHDPATYMRLFAELAYAHGYSAIMTPARDLMAVSGAVCGQRSGETLSDAFLRCDIAGAAARYADVYQIQSQVLEADPSAFRAFVQAAADQAVLANPRILVMGGLSTTAVTGATAQMLFNAWSSVRGVVAGHYMTIDSASVNTLAVPFFRMVKAAGG